LLNPVVINVPLIVSELQLETKCEQTFTFDPFGFPLATTAEEVKRTQTIFRPYWQVGPAIGPLKAGVEISFDSDTNLDL
jgi:hypothetical protein